LRVAENFAERFLKWRGFLRTFDPVVRNRAGFDSVSVRFWFVFVPLGDVEVEEVVRAVRFRFDFVPVLVRFRFGRF
jgi:hypothetical protein